VRAGPTGTAIELRHPGFSSAGVNDSGLSDTLTPALFAFAAIYKQRSAVRSCQAAAPVAHLSAPAATASCSMISISRRAALKLRSAFRSDAIGSSYSSKKVQPGKPLSRQGR